MTSNDVDIFFADTLIEIIDNPLRLNLSSDRVTNTAYRKNNFQF
mgnify:CR=1 FL=1